VCFLTLKTIQYLPPAAAVGGIVDQLADKPINPNDKKVYVLALGVAFNCDN
jgi:hypothetical protein